MSNLNHHNVYFIVILFVFLCSCGKKIGNAHEFGLGRLDREELIVTNVTSDENFLLVKNVSFWKTISSGEKTYAVGLMELGLTVLNFNVNQTNQDVYVLNTTVIDFELFHYWDEKSQTNDVILILGTYNQTFELVWFKIEETRLEQFWKVQIKKNITHLSTLKFADDKQMLSIVTTTESVTTLDLYEFDFSLRTQNLCLYQSIPLDEPTAVLTTNTFGPDTYLSVAQKRQQTVMVFKCTKNQFKPYQNISVSNVVQLVAFKIGFKPFLAIASDSASIYQFTSKGLEEKLTLNQVDFWLAISVKTYHQDVLLLAQRVIQHDGFPSHLVEVLTYNGKQFVTHDEIPCTYLGESESGLTCMVDEEKKDGLFGSAVLNLGKSVRVLVPRREHSVLFSIETSLRKLQNPIEIERMELIEMKERIQKIIQKRREEQVFDKNEGEGIIDKKDEEQKMDEKETEQIIDKKEEEQIIDQNEEEQIIDHKKENQIIDKKEEEQIINKKEEKHIIDPKEAEQIIDHKDEEEIIDQKEEKQISDHKEEKQTIDKKEEEQIIDPKEAEQIMDHKEEKQTIDKKEEEQIIDPKEAEQIMDHKEEKQIIDHKKEEQIIDKKEEEQIIDPKEAEQIIDHKDEEQIIDQKVEEQIIDKIKEDQIVSAFWNPQLPSAASVKENFEQLQMLRNQVLAIRRAIENAKFQLRNTIVLNNTRHVFKQLTINGNVRVLGQTSFRSIVTQKLNGDSPKAIFNDFVRKDNISLITGPKTFFNLQMENLNFVKLNDIDAELCPTLSNGNFTFKKPVHVKGNIVVNSGEVNGIYLPNEVILMSKPYEGSLSFENIKIDDDLQVGLVNELAPPKLENNRGDFNPHDDILDIEELTIVGNVTTGDVNGENFDDLLKSLCFTNSETNVPGEVILDGDLIIRNELNSPFLNNLKFPEEYAMTDRQFTNVTGNKIFAGTTEADRILSDGTINEVLVDNIITSDLNQTVAGNYTFEKFEIVQLYINGTVDNEHVKNIKPNPTLLDGNEINARANFNELKVEGNIIISDNYDGVNLNDILSDVVYKDENESAINSIKYLMRGLTVYKGISVSSNSLNEFPLDSFITTNTEQDLSFEILNGSIGFEYLALDGLFDDVNITELERESIKLDGQQFVSSVLDFVNNNDEFVDLTATDFVIVDTLNNLTSEEYFYKNGEGRKFSEDVEFDIVVAENIDVKGNVSGPIVDFSLEEFNQNRLSLTEPKVISSKYVVKNLICNHFKTNFINGVPFQDMFDYDAYADLIANKLINGELVVDNLIVNGSIEATHLNGKNVTEVFKNYIWTNKDNKLKTATFNKDVIFQNLKLEHLNGMKFDQMVEDVVLKTETNPTINSLKHFTDGIHVVNFLNSERINGIHVDHVWRKTGNQIFSGPLYVDGDVIIASNCAVDENLNSVPMGHLKDTYQFPDDDGTCVVNGDLMMNRLQYIDNMVVQGAINGNNLEEFLQNLVLTSSSTKFEHNFEFKNHVQIKQNFVVENLINGVDLSEFVQDMVFITKDELLDGGIIFTAPVTIKGELLVTKHLLSKEICGIDLSKWVNDAIFINRGRIPGKLIFESATIHEYLNLNLINDLDVTTLIPLRTDQHINASLTFTEISPFREISVGGLVNGLNLNKEYENSLQMNKTSQDISSKIIFQNNVMVWESLSMLGLLNNNSIEKIVTTKTEQNLSSIFTFGGNATFDKMEIRGLANGINVTKWNEEAVKTYSTKTQIIKSKWNVLENVTFVQNVESFGLIGGMDVVKVKQQIDERHSNDKLGESGPMAHYNKVCRQVNQISKMVQKQPYLFKYFEHVQELDFRFEWDIKKAFPFEHDNEKYLLVAFQNICTANLFIWENYKFKLLELFEMGSISQIIPIYDGHYLFFATRNDNDLENCQIQGTNLWKFEDQAFKAIYKLESTQLLEKSLIPRTFYALEESSVVEYKITSNLVTDVKPYRKWNIFGANMTFVPRGLGTGLALSDGYNLIKLLRDDSLTKDEFSYNYDETILGKIVQETDSFSAGRFKNEVQVLNVGLGATRRSLLASTFHEDVVVRGRFDFIKIYEDMNLFQKIPTYKPTSLISLEFGNNGETLLLFLEDEKSLQIYEYKGIEGFLERTQIITEGSSLFSLALQLNKNQNENQVVGVIHKNEIKFLQALMSGNEIQIEEQHCDLL